MIASDAERQQHTSHHPHHFGWLSLVQAVELVANKSFQANDVERALKEVYLRMDDRLAAEEHREELGTGPLSAGCTAVCAVVRGGTLYVANAGDSRCVLGRAGTAVAMSEDHRPDNAAEFKRIQKV